MTLTLRFQINRFGLLALLRAAEGIVDYRQQSAIPDAKAEAERYLAEGRYKEAAESTSELANLAADVQFGQSLIAMVQGLQASMEQSGAVQVPFNLSLPRAGFSVIKAALDSAVDMAPDCICSSAFQHPRVGELTTPEDHSQIKQRTKETTDEINLSLESAVILGRISQLLGE